MKHPAVIKHLLLSVSLAFVIGCDEQLCDERIKKACFGCSPYMEQLSTFIRTLDKTLRTEVKKCIDLSTDAKVKSVEYVTGTLKGCISSDIKIDDKTRDELFKKIDQVPLPQQQYDAWIHCYSGIVNPSKPLIVLMDSHIRDVVYCEHTQKIGGSNADDIINLLKGLPVGIATVSTNLEWKDDQRVVEMKPALVVLHASAFYEKTKEVGGNQRLFEFLDSLRRAPNTKILVYTRGLPDQRTPEIIDRWKVFLAKLKNSELEKRTELFIMPKGYQSCFDDPAIAVPFQKKIIAMLGLTQS